MKKILLIQLLLFGFGWIQVVNLYGQSEKGKLNINWVEVNAEGQRVELRMSAKRGNREIPLDSFQTFIIKERLTGESAFKPLTTQRPDNLTKGSGTTTRNYATMLFVLDVSGSMKKKVNGISKFEKAKEVIRNTVMNHSLPISTYLVSFSDTINGVNQPINRGNIDEQLRLLEAYGETDLNHTLFTKVQELNQFKGPKVIFLVSDGRDDTRKIYAYQQGARYPIAQSTVLDHIAKVPENFRIFTIGLGDPYAKDESKIDEGFLKAVKDKTPSPKDEYLYAATPDKLDSLFEEAASQSFTNLEWWFFPEKKNYDGTKREIQVYGLLKSDKDQEFARDTFYATAEYAEGTKIDQVNLEEKASSKNMAFNLLIGLVLVVLSLVLLIFLFPTFAFIAFKRKYIMKFGEHRRRHSLSDKKVKHTDPYSGDIIEDDDVVVAICEHVMKLDSWQENKDRCVNYPDSCSKGVGNYNTRTNFFLQQGVNRKLNWLWFGAVGGLLTWAMQTGLELAWSESIRMYFREAFGNSEASYLRACSMGLSIGFMLTFFLAMVEELGQSRATSFMRILLRGLIGAVVSIPIFFAAEWLNNNYATAALAYFFQFLAWSLLGTIMGAVVTIFSSIETSKGLRGGVIAGIAAFLVKLLFSWILGGNELSDLFSYIAFGAVLGIIIVTVVERLTGFELEYVAPPSLAGRKVAISKWLSTEGSSILIGTDKACEVFIKWADPEIRGKHARLSFDGRVHIEPLDDAPVYISERSIKGITELKDGDLIKLGISSTTRLRFSIKDSTDSINTSSIAPVTPARYTLEEEKAIKDKIKVNIRK